jgi:hypothetical protein
VAIVEDLVIGAGRLATDARVRSGEQARVRGDIIGAGVTTVRRIVVVVGLLVLVGCPKSRSIREQVGGDADGDADTDSDVGTDSDSEADQEGDADAEWCDGTSGLCWQDPPSSFVGRDWYSAVVACDALDLGGHGPGSWHLPTISELRSLIRGCPATETGGGCGVTDSCIGWGCWNEPCRGCSYREGPGTDGAYWPAVVSGPVHLYWSSSSAGWSADVWNVNFYDGDVYSGDETGLPFVRCVRGGP